MATIDPKPYKTKNNKEIIIRAAIKEDAGSTISIKKSSIDEVINELLCPEEFTRTVVDEEKWIDSHLDNPNHIAIVAVFENQIIGLIDFSNGPRKRIAHTGQFGMSVSKNFRGQGIGTLLLQALIEWATAHDQIEKINLSVHATNLAAQGLYKKLGFVIEGIMKNDLKYGADDYVDTLVMGKIL
jgi:RimJ/RimL family protein N-acetyltransferase